MANARNTDIVMNAAPVGKRRNRSKQERRAVVEETLLPGTSVAVIARSHGVNANQVFHWRKLYYAGQLDVKPAPAQLVPVHVQEVFEEKPQRSTQPTGSIHIELGHTRIRLEGSVDTEALRIVLEQLRR